MMRHRSGPSSQANDDASSSSSDEDDVFSALSKKRKIDERNKAASINAKEAKDSDRESRKSEDKPSNIPKNLPPPTTSSNKRHHGAVSESRKAKMDALLLELEAEKNRKSREPRKEFRPEKKGSFVEPGEEHLTTNIFIGNLSPSITEEQLTDLFRQFGDLYSVKIMWPRNAEERARNRNTGFVCFMNRQDAEDAMEACNEADPFNVGRRIMLRWGKNVKRDPSEGAAPISKKSKIIESAPVNPSIDINDERKTIRVLPPVDKVRANFISVVASYVAKDGFQLEQALIEREAQNMEYDFLILPPDANEKLKQENIYYKWRVYSFCQGDTLHTWRTEPFQMFHPHGCVWIPPPLDVEASRKEQQAKREKEEEIQKQKQQRQFISTSKGIKTGRQIEQSRKVKPEAAANLTEDELIEFETLFKEQLCGSRESICRAMAFCFEKGVAAKQISSMLDDLFLQLRPGISVETIIARFFLISDILFNSQQPGVRNAFMYRATIEKRAHEWFESVGDFARQHLGRMRVERLASTINSIFAAWATWHVFDPAFMDELQLRFEGRKHIIQAELNNTETAEKGQLDKQDVDETLSLKSPDAPVSTKPLGKWAPVHVTDSSNPPIEIHGNASEEKDKIPAGIPNNELQKLRQVHAGSEDDKKPDHTDLEVDGEPFDEDENDAMRNESDGEPLDEDADGEPLSSDDADGEPLEGADFEEEDPDGEPLGDDDIS